MHNLMQKTGHYSSNVEIKLIQQTSRRAERCGYLNVGRQHKKRIY